MIITKKALPRRTFLRGLQATLALPLLDAMIPAATALARTPAKPVPRLGYVFIPMGCDHARWTPPGQGALGELSPILAPLDPVREQLTVVTNLELENSYPGTHDTSNSGFLSAAFAKHTESSDYHLGTTADQLAAKQIGQDTQLLSLELSMDLDPLAGVCNNGYACVYQNSLSWSSPTTPLPSEAHPRIVFERLFGEGGSPEERRAALRSRASLLDAFGADIARLKGALAAADRTRVDQYLDSIREVERQIQHAETAAMDNPEPELDRPMGVPGCVCGPRQPDVRLAGPGFAGRYHPSHHVPADARAQQPHVSGDRRARSASSHESPRERPRETRQDRQDQHVPRVAVLGVPPEVGGHAGRRRVAARSHHLSVRERDREPEFA